MTTIPGLGIAKGMALTLRRFFQPKVTVQYPEQTPQIPPRHRGRLQLLYDEFGELKCETCFQCAMACPIECIDMGGTDTKDRFHVHWGPPEQYAERREEDALRRSGRPVPDRAFAAYEAIDAAALDRILEEEDHDPAHMLRILERTQDFYGYVPVAALRHISSATGAWYAGLYGIASFYGNIHLHPPTRHVIGLCRCPSCSLFGAGAIRSSLESALGIGMGRTTPGGAVTLVPDECHGENGGAAWVTLDGRRQASLDADAAAALARSLLAGGTP